MSACSVDNILRLCASLEPHGARLPGKPPKRKAEVPLARRRLLPVRDTGGHVIGYSRFRCGASQSQTRSANPHAFSPLDVAGDIGMAHLDQEHRWLLEFICGDQLHSRAMKMDLASELHGHAKWKGWRISPEFADRIVELSLEMLIEADGCQTCNTHGQLLDSKGQLVECHDCRGSGHVCMSERAVAKRWSISQPTYHRKYAQAVHWMLRVLQGRTHAIDMALRGDDRGE